jgi:hypothetical protein
LCIKDKILIEVATSDWLKHAAKNICPLHHEDLQQHLLLILCEMPDYKLIDLHKNGYLKYFCIKVMFNQTKSPRQAFNKLFATIGEYDVYVLDLQDLQEINNLEYKITKENQLQTIEKVVSKNQWYEREIFTQWATGNSARSIHRQTKISLREVLRVIKEIKEQINNEYNN